MSFSGRNINGPNISTFRDSESCLNSNFKCHERTRRKKMDGSDRIGFNQDLESGRIRGIQPGVQLTFLNHDGGRSGSSSQRRRQSLRCSVFFFPLSSPLLLPPDQQVLDLFRFSFLVSPTVGRFVQVVRPDSEQGMIRSPKPSQADFPVFRPNERLSLATYRLGVARHSYAN